MLNELDHGKMLEDVNTDRMVELWRQRSAATTDFERGYYQGRFEEYAAQNAIDPDDFEEIRAAAAHKAMAKEVASREP